MKRIFLTTNRTNANFWLSWRKPLPDGLPRAAKALPIREIRVIGYAELKVRSCRNKSVKSAKSVVFITSESRVK